MKKITIGLFTILFLIGCREPDKYEQPKSGTIRAVDSLINKAIEKNHIPGAVIQIKQGDSVLHRSAHGYAKKFGDNMDPLPNPEEMTSGHLFDLASLTKVCATTFGMMILVDEGKVQLDDPIYTYLPEFNKGEKSKITIRNLLSHSAGLYQWKPTYYHAANAEERYQYIAGLPLKWKVGEARHYSDLGFMLLGDIIKKVSGEPLDQFLREELYQPLSLKNTAFNPLKKGFTKIAATSHGNYFEKKMVYDDDFGYEVDVNPDSWDGWRNYTLQGEVNDGNAWYANGGVAGHAGLFSTVGDLQVLVDLLLDKSMVDGRQIISSAVIDTFLTKDRFSNGLGWAMDKEVIAAQGSPSGTFGHTGFTGTNIVAMPKYDLSIILLTNRQHVDPQPSGYYFDLGPLRQDIVDAVLGYLDSKED